MFNQEAFTYCWTDHRDNMLYIGYHKGSQDDGYVCSSDWMLEEHNKRPSDFTRIILAEGTTEDCHVLEVSILKAVDAMHSDRFYNMTNGDDDWICKKVLERTRIKISDTRKRKMRSGEIIPGMNGKKHSKKTIQQMSRSQKEKWEKMPQDEREGFKKMRSEFMKGKPSPRKGKKASQELRKRLSILHAGDKNVNFGSFWVTNGCENKRIYKDNSTIPNDWYRGRTMRPYRRSCNGFQY